MTGHGDREPKEILEAFKSRGLNIDVHIILSECLVDKVKEAVRRGIHIIAVAGGDGTMSTAARAFTGQSSILVPIPTGTLNHFARRHGITSVDKAAQAIIKVGHI